VRYGSADPRFGTGAEADSSHLNTGGGSGSKLATTSDKAEAEEQRRKLHHESEKVR
jgi:hypothetical protein